MEFWRLGTRKFQSIRRRVIEPKCMSSYVHSDLCLSTRAKVFSATQTYNVAHPIQAFRSETNFEYHQVFSFEAAAKLTQVQTLQVKTRLM